jgi:hypothetical protein
MYTPDDRLPCMICGAPTRYVNSPDHEGLCLNCTPPPRSAEHPDGVPTVPCTECGTPIPDAEALQLIMPFTPRRCPPCDWPRTLQRLLQAGEINLDPNTPMPRPHGHHRGGSTSEVDFNMYVPADRYGPRIAWDRQP